MTVQISVAFIAVAVVALVVFLIISLLKLNRLIDRTSFLVDRLNQDLPGLLADLRNVGANLHALSEHLSLGVSNATAAAAEGVEYLKNFKLFGVLLDAFTMIRRIARFLGKIAKRT